MAMVEAVLLPVASNPGSRPVIAGWLQIILAQLHLILARAPDRVANNPGWRRSLLLVWCDLIAGSNK